MTTRQGTCPNCLEIFADISSHLYRGKPCQRHPSLPLLPILPPRIRATMNSSKLSKQWFSAPTFSLPSKGPARLE